MSEADNTEIYTALVKVIEALSHLNHAERDAVLVRLLNHRSHWFNRPRVLQAIDEETEATFRPER